MATTHENKPLSYRDTSNALTKLKKEEDKTWLKEVSSVPLQQGLRHLNTAFENFFKGRTKYPKFKKKNNRNSATYASNAFKWIDGAECTSACDLDFKSKSVGGKLILAKMSQPLKIRWSRYFNGEPRSVTVSRDAFGRYFVSFLVEEELKQWAKKDGQIGVDLGIRDVMVTSTGMKSGNPKYYQKYQLRLHTLQRKLASKKKARNALAAGTRMHSGERRGSNNRYKARRVLARLHAKIADCRQDFLHKLTTQLVRENQAIYTETLAVKNMMANHKLAKAIADCGWGEALRQFQYKCQWHERDLGAIDRWFPSSKRCNPCGHILDKLALDVREWICPSCNSLNLRDENAAKNILAVGQTVYACGLGNDGDITSVVSS